MHTFFTSIYLPYVFYHESFFIDLDCQFDSIQISIDRQQQQLQVDSINDEFGLFNDDDDEDNLTLFGKKIILIELGREKEKRNRNIS